MTASATRASHPGWNHRHLGEQGGNRHSPSSTAGLWHSGSLPRGETFPFTFTEPGASTYRCRVHVFQNMRGTITVVGAP